MLQEQFGTPRVGVKRFRDEEVSGRYCKSVLGREVEWGEVGAGQISWGDSSHYVQEHVVGEPYDCSPASLNTTCRM